MSFSERQKILQALWRVSHKGLFVHGQSVQCQEKSLAQGGVTLSEIKFWPPFTSSTLRLKKKKVFSFQEIEENQEMPPPLLQKDTLGVLVTRNSPEHKVISRAHQPDLTSTRQLCTAG